jgi:hypothetical protein
MKEGVEPVDTIFPSSFLFLKKEKKKTSLQKHHPPTFNFFLRKIYTTRHKQEKKGRQWRRLLSTLYTHT